MAWRAGFVGCAFVVTSATLTGCPNVRGPAQPGYAQRDGSYRDLYGGHFIVAANGQHVDVHGVLFGDIAVLADDDPAAPLRLRDTSTNATVTLAPRWSAAMLLETETSTRHRRGDRRLVASCALGDGGAMVALRLDVDEAFAAGHDTTVTTPLTIEGGMAGECAVSTDGARVAVIDGERSQLTLVELDGLTPPRQFPGVYDRVAFAGTDMATSELGVELIAARTGTVTQVLIAEIGIGVAAVNDSNRQHSDGGRWDGEVHTMSLDLIATYAPDREGDGEIWLGGQLTYHTNAFTFADRGTKRSRGQAYATPSKGQSTDCNSGHLP